MKIRIVNLDFYMSNSIPGLDIQYSEFRGSSITHVPVIRIYGSTEEGEKICLHVHGVFPYIYIPYDGQIGVDGFMYQIALGLDKAINISLGQTSSNTQHVYKVCLISGIPFYGYHARQHQFLKIYFYNPLIIKKACTLLQNGNILGKIYQPHEAHIPYILQFMIDYNLHGMSFINVSDLKYRADDYTSNKYPENTVLPPSIRKMSICKIEADTKSECILNRDEITPGRLAVNPGIKALWDDEKQRRRNNGESSQMEQFLTQNRIDKPPTSTHIAYKKMLDEKLRLKPKLSATSPELELSVYPAETPPDSNLLNASTIDVTSSQNTDDSSILDVTITNESILDEDGRELYDLLRDLKEDNIEKDSILSQVQKEDESDGENDIDLSLPLDGNMRTPQKIEEFLNDSYFETIGKLPQLDGVCDDDLEEQPCKSKIKKNKINDSDKSKDGASIPSITKKARKRKSKKKNTKENKIYPINQYASLDGPNDSSSDEDQPVKPAVKRRCVQPRRPLSESLKYSPLKVHYGSPTKSTDLQKQVNRSPISFTDQDGKETSKKFKRKLSFSRKAFNKTQSEEKLTCVYRSNKKTSSNIVSIPTPTSESTINLTQNESSISLITPYQKPPIDSVQTGNTSIDSSSYQREKVGVDPENNRLDLGLLIPTMQTLEPSNCISTVTEIETSVSGGEQEQSGVSLITPYQKSEIKFIKNYNTQFSDSSASLSDDIFSPNLPNSFDMFSFDDESNGDKDEDPAKLYDVLNNYIPQAGTSKLTPKQLSSNSVGSDDNKSSENDVITPYQKEIAPLSVFEFANQNFRTGPVSIIPKIPPPSRKLIEANLRDYNIPEVHHKEAFYSNAKDVTGPVEIGVKVLRILSDNIADLPEFESSFKGIDHYRREYLEQIYPDDKITIKDVNDYKKSFCKISNCVITPAELPPTKGEINLWLKNKLQSNKEKSIQITERKKRILIPRSPGNDQDDNSDDSLTISPCTPLDETLKNAEEQENESPVIKRNEVLKRYQKRKSLHSSEDSSGKTLELTLEEKRHDSRQITGVTLDGSATSCDNLQNARAVSEYLNLTVFCMELIIETRSNYNPDPSHDVIKGIIYKIFNDVPEDDPSRKRSVRGCFLLDNTNTSPTKEKFSILDGIIIENDDVIKTVKSEEELIMKFVEFFVESDPDILIGYEIEMLSWGYLIERGYTLNLNLISLLSRVPISTKNKPEDDQSDLTIPGRIILDFWRLLRHEIALQSYTFENIVYHILHQRAPLYSFKTLTNWWNHTSGLYRNKVVLYYYYRIDAILKIVERLDLIGRTSELAKLFGIQFFEVLSRGSQFRVESMMLRLAKPLNYIAVSPSMQQRAKMRAPESLPLIMEPESKFYVDPVIVLDFQSLYPSMIIAYNYCFSTCLGRIEHLGQNIPFEFGATHLKIPRKYVKNLSRKNLINISPCGVGYVKRSVREGILPKMLQEILDTRLMVKKSLKKNSGNKTLEKVLDARQLGLKLIANVTYGYTAANFSGRMPCIEVGDSVVSKGRETLQRAINLVEKTAEWGARVVYGDTDSLFVLIPGRSREEAFRIGAKIAEAVTEDNPSPVKLKLEKIFHPCILQTKKRYVGYMFESPDQVEPEYCAKGIETVRRDGCPAVSKMLEKCLKILFETRDVSLVRQYVVRQFSKILTGRISIQDLTFAKEYRGASDYRPGACVPALELARKWVAVDKRSEPRRKERVPYVIINGPPGLPLIKLVRSPRELIADPSLRPNALYYITKVIIPPINRCFLLIGADVNNWFNDMPRKQYTSYQHNSSPVKGKKSTISQYFSTRNCAICAKQSKDGLCDSCLLKPQCTSAVLHEKIRVLEQNYFYTKKICELCCCTSDKIMCISLDCPVYYKRVQINKEIEQTPFFRELITMLPSLDF